MKKLLPLFVILMLGFVACNDTSNVEQYSGTYKGQFTMGTDNTTKDGSVVISPNALVDNGIFLYYILPLELESGSTFSTSSTDTEMMTQVLSKILGDHAVSAEEVIERMDVKAVFTGSELNLKLTYNVNLGSGLGVDVRIIEFTGSK